MFVVHPRVDHGDVDVFASEAEVPRTNGIEGRVSSLDGRRLDVAVEHDVAVAFHHDHVLERSELEHERRIDLTQQHGINRFNDVNHAEIVGGEFSQVTVVDVHAVGEADPCGADVRFEAVVDSVAILVERRSLPPRCVVVEPGRFGLIGDIKTVVRRHPLQSLSIHSFPADRFGFDKQRARDRAHQQRKHEHGKHSTHVLPQTNRILCATST